MCIATPVQITKKSGLSATVEHNGAEFQVSLQLIPEAKVGDWILTHGEMAVTVLPEGEAANILALLKKSTHPKGGEQ